MIAPVGDGVLILSVTILMLTLSYVFFISRISVRRWLEREAFRLDDYLMGIGLLLHTTTAILMMVSCFHGAGQLRTHLEPGDIMMSTKLLFVTELLHAASTVPIKASICTTLLRLADAPALSASRRTLHGVTVASAVAAVVFIVGVANVCHPISGLWSTTTAAAVTAGVCHPMLYHTVSFIFAIMCVATNCTLALLPAALLWDVRMPGRVRLGVGLMLGLGTFASCAIVIRLYYRFLDDGYDQTELLFRTAAQAGLWSMVETGMGITAGSMAALRPLLDPTVFTQCLSRHYAKTRLVSASPLPACGDSDGESQKGSIWKETMVVMTEETCDASMQAWQRQRVAGWEE